MTATADAFAGGRFAVVANTGLTAAGAGFSDGAGESGRPSSAGVFTHASSAPASAPRVFDVRGFVAATEGESVLTHFGLTEVFAGFAAGKAFFLTLGALTADFRFLALLFGSSPEALFAIASTGAAVVWDFEDFLRFVAMKERSLMINGKAPSRFRHNKSLRRRDATTTFDAPARLRVIIEQD